MTIRVMHGDCRDELAKLADASVHMVCTSPPYYGLRDYGTGTWEGGDAECDHRVKQQKRGNASYTNGQGEAFASNMQAWGDRDVSSAYRDTCGKCGARRIDRQIGLERTAEEYLATMVQVFREIRRVLRPDATCWVNLGDSYNCKQLQMMPARLAIALQADGWWLRSMLPWVKRSAMPESVTDRPATAVEYVFMLTRSARYYWDAEAVKRGAQYGFSQQIGAKIWNHCGTPGEPGHTSTTTVPGNGGSRNLRNSDLFYDSIDECPAPATSLHGAAVQAPRGPHGLICDAAGEPLALDVNPAALKSAVVGGSYRIASPDCAVHDYQEVLARALEYDAQQAADASDHSPGNGARPAPTLEGAGVAIPLGRHASPFDAISATGHSIQSRRTDGLSGPGEIFVGIPLGRTECTQLMYHSVAKFCRKPVSSNGQGASPDALHSDPSARNQHHIFGTLTFERRPLGCSCEYVGKVEKRQDHYASFPPKLVEPLIRGGTSERGCCAQCGAPWRRTVTRMRTRDGEPLVGSFNTGDGYKIGASGVGHWRDTTTAETTGWAPSCACGTFQCIPCGFVLDTKDVTQEAKTKPPVRSVRNRLPTMEEGQHVLQPGVLPQGVEAIDRTPVHPMPGEVHADVEQAEMLLEAVRPAMERSEPLYNEGMDDNLDRLQADPCAKASEREPGRLRPGTSLGDGEVAGPTADERRGGSPQERQSAGQSASKPRTDGKASTRRIEEATIHGDMSSLPDGVSGERKCPHCGSRLQRTTPNTVPCTILDCFGGAGTTAMVADRLQRDAIHIDLSDAYNGMAMARITDDAPLFTSWAPAEDPEDARVAELFAEPEPEGQLLEQSEHQLDMFKAAE